MLGIPHVMVEDCSTDEPEALPFTSMQAWPLRSTSPPATSRLPCVISTRLPGGAPHAPRHWAQRARVGSVAGGDGGSATSSMTAVLPQSLVSGPTRCLARTGRFAGRLPTLKVVDVPAIVMV